MAKLFITEDPRSANVIDTITHLYPSIDPINIQTYLMIRKLGTELETALDNFFSIHGLSAGRYLLLVLLKSNPEGLKPTDLSLKVGVTQATISGLIASLEKAGFVQRETHQKDGRAFVIKLTEKGLQTLEGISPTFFSRVEQLMSTVAETEKIQMIETLATLTSRVKILNQSDI